MSLALLVLAVLILGLMCGSELNLAAFAHPALNRQRLETHTLVRSSLAALLGRVMPFWMTGSALLNMLLLLPYVRLSSASWWLAASAFHPSSLGHRVFPGRTGPHQQPNCELDTTVVAQRLAIAGASLGFVSLVQNGRTHCRVRTAYLHRRHSLISVEQSPWKLIIGEP